MLINLSREKRKKREREKEETKDLFAYNLYFLN